ncbi:hypothetical protein ONZ45_g16599 [Pleurotus djamor]|nr:hypothetical protein ONZ45_g16599 [Pleurotus djamor]
MDSFAVGTWEWLGRRKGRVMKMEKTGYENEEDVSDAAWPFQLRFAGRSRVSKDEEDEDNGSKFPGRQVSSFKVLRLILERLQEQPPSAFFSTTVAPRRTFHYSRNSTSNVAGFCAGLYRLPRTLTYATLRRLSAALAGSGWVGDGDKEQEALARSTDDEDHELRRIFNLLLLTSPAFKPTTSNALMLQPVVRDHTFRLQVTNLVTQQSPQTLIDHPSHSDLVIHAHVLESWLRLGSLWDWLFKRSNSVRSRLQASRLMFYSTMSRLAGPSLYVSPRLKQL